MRSGRGRASWRPVLRPRARLALACAAAILVLGGAWLWVRDSPLVSVDRVTVTGETGPDSAKIRQSLVAAARTMTTLDLHINALRTAVAPFPIVKGLHVSTEFPHGIRIRVIEEVPVGEVQFDGQTVAVAADGRLLRDGVAAASLPLIPVSAPPGGKHVTGGAALRALAVLAAAPPQLLEHISEVTAIAPHGLVVELRSGPAIYFGDLTDLQAKWLAASEVLADPRSVGAAHVDVTDPQHPAAGSSAGGGSITSAAAVTNGGSGAGGGAIAGAGGAAGSEEAASASTAATSGSVAGTGAGGAPAGGSVAGVGGSGARAGGASSAGPATG